MNPPPLPSSKSAPPARPPKSWFTGGKITAIIVAVVVGILAAVRSGGVAALPLFIGTTFLPLWWLARLIGGLKQGIITSRIRTGSRTAQLISYSLAGPPDVYHRKTTPGRFWMAWWIEVALFIFIAPFFLVIVVGVMLEGGPE